MVQRPLGQGLKFSILIQATGKRPKDLLRISPSLLSPSVMECACVLRLNLGFYSHSKEFLNIATWCFWSYQACPEKILGGLCRDSNSDVLRCHRSSHEPTALPTELTVPTTSDASRRETLNLRPPANEHSQISSKH